MYALKHGSTIIKFKVFKIESFTTLFQPTTNHSYVSNYIAYVNFNNKKSQIIII